MILIEYQCFKIDTGADDEFYMFILAQGVR